MPMSPRLLRPRATGFNPRSISGLALWLDAADSASLYTTDAGPVTPVTDPRDITGCVLWLDGADASTVTESGGSVSEWRDKTAGARHFTASSTAQPTYTATLNGRNVLTFNGSTNTMTGNAAAQDAIRNRAGYTFFAVSKVGSVAAGERLLCGFGGTVIFRAGQTGSSPYAGGRRVSGDSLENITGAASSLAVGSSYITSAIVNHTAQSLTGNLNGSGFASDTTYMAAGSSENLAMHASVGSQSSGYGFYNGDIAEVIIFDTALSTADRARVEAYLAAKWGISGVHAPATATNDPVGAWLDKSGNNRHATQATAGNRPLISSENNRAALAFDGSNDKLAHTVSGTIGADGVTFIAAINHNLTSQPTFLSTPVDLSSGNSGRPITRWASSPQDRLFVGVSFADVATSFRSRSGRFVYALDGARDSVSSGTHTLRDFANGAVVGSGNITASWSTASQVLTVGARDDNGTLYKGNVCEVLCYGRVLTTAERQRVERYLASKWGITLAPQVSNADAQDWINRVYGNGGTVSAATATAVNTFCDSIDSAGIRDRFLRLSLLCGDNLTAARVPLYVNTSASGATLGNAIDTNNSFSAGDYTLTGGIKCGTSRSLNTGLAPDNADYATGHVSVWIRRTGTVGRSGLISTWNTGYTQPSLSIEYAPNNSNAWFQWYREQNPGAGTATGNHLLVTRRSTTDQAWYTNAALGAQETATTTTTATSSIPWHIGCRRVGTTSEAFSDENITHYSIGRSMTASQITAFYSALQTFMTALGR